MTLHNGNSIAVGGFISAVASPAKLYAELGSNKQMMHYIAAKVVVSWNGVTVEKMIYPASGAHGDKARRESATKRAQKAADRFIRIIRSIFSDETLLTIGLSEEQLSSLLFNTTFCELGSRSTFACIYFDLYKALTKQDFLFPPLHRLPGGGLSSKVV